MCVYVFFFYFPLAVLIPILLSERVVRHNNNTQYSHNHNLEQLEHLNEKKNTLTDCLAPFKWVPK